MRPVLLSVLCLWLLSCGGVTFAAAAADAVDQRLDRLFGEHEPYRAFLRELQQAVGAGARQRVAAMVSYPLRTTIQGRAVALEGPRQFLAHYDALLTQKTRAAIARQSYEGLFASSRGVMIGDGEVWFGGICADTGCSARTIKIIAFNP